MNTIAIYVLRMPEAPNVSYHTSCYTSTKGEIVQRWIQNPENPPCAVCGRGIWDVPPVVQLSLFEEVA